MALFEPSYFNSLDTPAYMNLVVLELQNKHVKSAIEPFVESQSLWATSLCLAGVSPEATFVGVSMCQPQRAGDGTSARKRNMRGVDGSSR